MKYFLFFLFSLANVAFSQEIAFKDSKFEKQLLEKDEYYPERFEYVNGYSGDVIDINNNGKIEVSEALNIAGMHFSNFHVDTNPEFAYFRNLTKLQINSYDADSVVVVDLDLNQNLQLKELVLTTHVIKSIKVDKCSLLENLRINSDINLNLDLSTNKNLQALAINLQHRGSLDINLSGNPKLFLLELENCKLQRLDVSKNNQLARLFLRHVGLTNIDLSANIKLETFECSNAKLLEINSSGLNNLRSLDIHNNNLSQLILSDNLDLEYATIYGNKKISDLDLSHLKKLSFINCDTKLNQHLKTKYKGLPLVKFIQTNYIEEKFVASESVVLNEQEVKEFKDFISKIFSFIKDQKYTELHKLYVTEAEVSTIYKNYDLGQLAKEKYAYSLKNRKDQSDFDWYRERASDLLANPWNPEIKFEDLIVDYFSNSFRISHKNVEKDYYSAECSFYIDNHNSKRHYRGFGEFVKTDNGWKIFVGPDFK